MLEILMELGLTEEMAEKVISAIEKYEEEKADSETEEILPEGEKKEAEAEEEKEEKPEIPPMGEADDDIPSKEEFEKMGYLARLELAKVNPEAYDRLKNGR